LDKFIASLASARDNMQGHITLADTEYGYMLDDMSTPADYQSAGKYNNVNQDLEGVKEYVQETCSSGYLSY